MYFAYKTAAGPEPVPPPWRYTRENCTFIGTGMTRYLNGIARNNSISMIRQFTSKGCILTDQYGARGVQGAFLNRKTMFADS